MVFLAAFLAVASFGLAGTVDRLAGVAWLFVLLPILYLAVDLAEDTMLTRFLLSPDTITAVIVTTVQRLTRIKIWTLSISAVQVVLLGLCRIG